MVPILWRQKLRQQARWLHLVSQGRLSYRQWPEDQVSPSDRVSVLQAFGCLGGHGREGKRTKQKREGNDEQLLISSRKPACASIIISGLP